MRRPEFGLAEGRQVHLWLVRLEASEECFERALHWLSPEEAARAARFHFDKHRRAFVFGRAALRGLLGGYLGMQPAELRFAYGPQGKPSLAGAKRPLRFNVSNSGNLAAYAFTLDCEIGVDVEQHRPLHDMQGIAERFFSPDETAELLEHPDAERTAAFFRCWTRKEAYIKALGGGLSIPLDSFRVSLEPGAGARMISLEGSPDAAHCWTLHDFVPGPECAGAIAYAAEPRTLRAGPVAAVDEVLNL